ncbi:hypothetical protein D3C87_1476050 [compost metagenome]
MLGGHCVDHIANGHIVLFEFINIDPNAQISLAETTDADLPNTGQETQLIQQVGICPIQHVSQISITKDRKNHDRIFFRILFSNNGRVYTRRQTELTDGGLNFLQCDVNVAVDIELQRDRSRTLPGARAHLFDTLDSQ